MSYVQILCTATEPLGIDINVKLDDQADLLIRSTIRPSDTDPADLLTRLAQSAAGSLF